MSIVIPTGQYEASLIWTNALTVKEFTTAFGFVDLSVSPRSDPAELADQVYEAFTGPTQPCNAAWMAVGWVFQGVSAVLMTGPGPLVGQHLEAVNGSGSDNDIPVNCAVLSKKNTALGGRRNRGRGFWPPIIAGMATDTNGTISGPDAGNLQDGINIALGSLEGNDWQPVLHHSDGSLGTPIVSVTVETLLASQRRRMR